MSYFNPIPPRKAVELVSKAELGDAARVLVDFAAAGLLKGYARLVETTDGNGKRSEVRDCRISRDLWRRIAQSRLSHEACTLPAIRLEASSDGSAPEVIITGIRFDDRSLAAAIEQHSGKVVQSPRVLDEGACPKALIASSPAPAIQAPRPHEPEPQRPAVVPIPEGAVTVTVKQAMAALGLGRTKINDMMVKGTLVRVKIDTRTLITTDSIRALLS